MVSISPFYSAPRSSMTSESPGTNPHSHKSSGSRARLRYPAVQRQPAGWPQLQLLQASSHRCRRLYRAPLPRGDPLHLPTTTTPRAPTTNCASSLSSSSTSLRFAGQLVRYPSSSVREGVNKVSTGFLERGTRYPLGAVRPHGLRFAGGEGCCGSEGGMLRARGGECRAPTIAHSWKGSAQRFPRVPAPRYPGMFSSPTGVGPAPPEQPNRTCPMATAMLAATHQRQHDSPASWPTTDLPKWLVVRTGQASCCSCHNRLPP